MSDLLDRFHNVMDSVNYQVDTDNREWVIYELEGFHTSDYAEADPCSDFTIKDVSFLKNKELSSCAELYNSFVTMNSIYSLIEIWMRSYDTENEVDYESLRKEITAFQTDTLFNQETRTSIIQAQKDLDMMFSKLNKDDDMPDLPISWWACDSLLGDQYAEILPVDIINRVDSVGKLTHSDWKEIRSTEKWQKIISGTNDSVKVDLFVKALNEASSFDEQCQLALCGGIAINSYILLPVMRRLLLSGKYSRYLYVLWEGWRCLTQTEYYGMSRDSVIADELYNLVRKKAFTTALIYYDHLSNDLGARYNTVTLATNPCIYRYGSFIFGNDAASTVMELFYDFGESEEDTLKEE